MILVTPPIRQALVANATARLAALSQGLREPDPIPVVRFFNPVGSAIWLATEIDDDDILFGLADLGFGCPELGSFALQVRGRRTARRHAEVRVAARPDLVVLCDVVTVAVAPGA